MRSQRLFFQGIFVGVAASAVTLVTAGAVRRARQRRAEAKGRVIIDGVRPPSEASLHARPAEEASAPRLESEAPDVYDERW
jgi:hypothetical protein